MLFGKKTILVGDIGGTNARFGVVSGGRFLYNKSFKCVDYSNLEELIKAVLSDPYFPKLKIDKTCLAIAGPVGRDRTRGQFTNLPWDVDINNLQKFSIGSILLINDFEALGYAYDTMSPSQYVELTSLGRNPHGIVALIGAGTGLGVGILSYEINKHRPIASEGGHVEIAFDYGNVLEMGLLKYMKNKHIPLDYESLLSGRGIVHIYDYLLLRGLKHKKILASDIKRSSPNQKPVIITKYALEEKDYLCIKTLELFIIFYARIAKNLCISTLCSELVIAGGISPNILPFMQESFLEAFTQHDRKHIRNILENTTVLIITDPNIGLIGAARASEQ